MRYFRKLSATVLTVALALTSMTAVFASDAASVANADKAVTLRDLGLYSGQDANDPRVGLEDALTTQDSLIFLAKLFGYYETASALADDQVAEDLGKFDDAASISEYAKRVVAYSAANGILSGSIDRDGRLFVGAKDTVTAARFATFMLKQMGYTVEDFKQSVAKLADTKGSRVDATLTGDLTRDAAVGAMYAALTAEKASGKTVITDIIGDNADLRAKAEKLGLIAAPVIADVAVESVMALNCKQIAVVFNQEMNKYSVESENFYEIYDKGLKKVELGDSSTSLDADKKTVIITLNKNVADKLTNSSQAKVIVKKEILSGRGVKLAEDAIFDRVAVQDGLLPTVTKVEATGERNIKITFSEPVYDNGNDNSIALTNFKVVSGTYTYFVQKATLDNNVINLEIETRLIEGPVAVTVNNAGLDKTDKIVDYAGYAVFKSTETFNYVKDTSVAVVTVTSAKASKVVLNFSKPVKGSNISLYHSKKNVESNRAKATETNYVNDITFYFDTLLPSGNLTLYLVNSEAENENIVDGFGVKVPDQTLTCYVEEVPDQPPALQASNDTTVPAIRCKVNRDESITLIFNKELDIEVATNPGNYVVKRLWDSKEIPVYAVIDDSMKSVELKFDPRLEDNTTYELLIKQYKYASGNVNTSEYTYNFKTLDYKYPEVIDYPENDRYCFAIAEKGEIFIIYSEAMNEAQMLDKGNYQVSLNQGETYMDLGDNDTITKVNDMIIQIYVKEFKDTDINPYVKIAPIMDLAGKRLYGSIEPYTVINIEPESVHIEEAQLIAKNKIRIVFNKKMKMESIVRIDFLINSTTPGAISVEGCESTTVNDDGKTEVVLILSKDLTTDGKDESGNSVNIATVDKPSSESEWGSKLRPQFSIALDDKIAPEIVMWDHDNNESTEDIAKVIVSGNLANPEYYNKDSYIVPTGCSGTITIFFSEDISESTLKERTFNVPGFVIDTITAPAETKTVILNVTAYTAHASVKTTVTQVSEIHDLAGNALATSVTWETTLDDIPLIN